MDKPRVAIADHEMAFALLDCDAGSQERCPGSSGVNDCASGKNGAVGELHLTGPDPHNCCSQVEGRSLALRAFDQEPSCAGRVEHTIFGNQEATRESLAQIWLETRQLIRTQHFNGYSTLAVIGALLKNFRHLKIVCCDPNGSALFVLDITRKLRSQLLPQSLRISGQRKLGFGVVYHNNVSHAGSGRSAADHVLINHGCAHSNARTLVSAGGTDNAGTYDHNVVSR